MPDRRWSRRSVAAFALTAGALTLALASPAASEPIESGPWAGSDFDPSVHETHLDHVFDISGLFQHSDDRTVIRDVAVDFEWASFPSADNDNGCTIPADKPSVSVEAEPEAPQDPNPNPAPEPPETSRFRFEVPDTEWPCNGTYKAFATPDAVAQADEPAIEATIVVRVPPAPVTSMEATVAGGEDAPDPETGATADDPATVEVSWLQLASPETDYPDFVGYRVQRAGPAGDSKFETVGNEVIYHDPELVTQEAPQQVTDTIEAPGEYRYRVQSLRAGPDGTGPKQVVAASVEEPVSVEIAGPPTTTTPPTTDATPTTRRPLALPDVGNGSNNPRSPLAVPGVPTTIDTGFDEELDYGDLPEPGEELAGEGQSVIQTEGEGAGLLGPVAGAMVLLGWAGHVAYLNRLAKQF